MKNFILTLLLVITFLHTNAQTLHLIMVSDYADPRFGIVSQADETALISLFNTTRQSINYEFSKTYLNNNNNNTFDSNSVIKTINSLHTKPEDIIVLFYSGFGYYPAKSKSTFPSFKLSDYKNWPLSLDDIANKIKAKTVRLGIVLADCRDSFYTPPVNPKPPIAILDTEEGMFLTEDFSKIILQKIFFEKSGILKIASASKGESTWQLLNKNNSVFISSFSGALGRIQNEPTTENANFDNVLKNSQGRMNKKLKEFDEASGISENKKQTANWTFTPYKKNENALLKQYPPDTFVYPSYEELKKELTVIANSNESIVRSNSSKTLLEMFTKDAKIEVKMIDEQTKNLNIEDYISQTAKYDKNAKREIEFKFYDYKRTQDFKKFMSLTFSEKTNQNP